MVDVGVYHNPIDNARRQPQLRSNRGSKNKQSPQHEKTFRDYIKLSSDETADEISAIVNSGKSVVL